MIPYDINMHFCIIKKGCKLAEGLLDFYKYSLNKFEGYVFSTSWSIYNRTENRILESVSFK